MGNNHISKEMFDALVTAYMLLADAYGQLHDQLLEIEEERDELWAEVEHWGPRAELHPGVEEQLKEQDKKLSKVKATSDRPPDPPLSPPGRRHG